MNRILSADDPLIKNILKDFRLSGDQLAKLRGFSRFRSSVFPELSPREIMIEIIHISERVRPNIIWRWLQAFRLPYLLFSLFPMILVVNTYLHQNHSLSISLTSLMFLSVSLMHISANLWSDYEDHLRGIDTPEHQGGSKVIQNLWIPAIHIRNAAMILFVTGLSLGLYLFFQIPINTGKYILFIGILSSLALTGYSGWPFHYKYLGLGEPILFLLSGPMATIGASLIYFRDISFALWFACVSLPLSFLAILRLHAGNMQRIPFDTMAESITIARSIGFEKSKWALGFLFFAPFIVLFFLIATQSIALHSAYCFALLPFLFFPLKTLIRVKGPLDPEFYTLRRDAVIFHFIFGLLYCFSFLI